MKISKISKQILTVLLLCAIVFCGGCTRGHDGPPENNKPLPPKLEGTYSGEHGTMRFILTGDDLNEGVNYGKVEVHLKDLNDEGAVMDGEMEYNFIWDVFGVSRYDEATQLCLSQEGTELKCYFTLNEIGDGIIKIQPYFARDIDGNSIDGLIEEDIILTLE